MSLQEQLDAALQAGDTTAAEALLRRAWTESGDPQILSLLVDLLFSAGRADDAETTVRSAAELTPSVALLNQLASLQYLRKAFDRCEQTLERLLATAPNQPFATYQLLSKVKFALGREDEAHAVMKNAAAARPAETEFVAAYADSLPAQDAITVLENHLHTVRGDPARMAYVILRISKHRAPGIRAAQGLPPGHGISWPDTYRWPDTEMLPRLKNVTQAQLALGSPLPTPRLGMAYIALAEGDWEMAERYIAKVRDGAKRTEADFTAFGAAFHAMLDAMRDEDIVGNLAPMHRLLSAAPRSGETIFIGSDRTYFERFTWPFARQLEERSLPLDLHVHILDGTEADWAEVRYRLAGLKSVGATLTAEASGAAARGLRYARNYYHAVRYIRLYETLAQMRRPMWIFDADVSLQDDPRSLLASLSNFDLALRTNPCSFTPTLKITATCVGIAPSTPGLSFARRVAAYIAHWKNKDTWGWGVDQVALFSSYAHMSATGCLPNTLFLDNAAMNDKAGDTGVIKFLSGIDKYAPNATS